MSTTPPPDRPTEPLRRQRPAPAPAPVPPPPLVEERVVAPVVDPNVILLRIEDTLDNLRTWLVIVGLVAVVALGIAIYAAIDDDTSRGGGSTSSVASDERVDQIENRVDRVSRQVQDLRTDGGGDGDTSALAGRIDALERSVRTLSGGQGAAGGTQDAIDELSGRIDDLAEDVTQLQQAPTQP